jgi:hypothetical protein
VHKYPSNTWLLATGSDNHLLNPDLSHTFLFYQNISKKSCFTAFLIVPQKMICLRLFIRNRAQLRMRWLIWSTQMTKLWNWCSCIIRMHVVTQTELFYSKSFLTPGRFTGIMNLTWLFHKSHAVHSPQWSEIISSIQRYRSLTRGYSVTFCFFTVCSQSSYTFVFHSIQISTWYLYWHCLIQHQFSQRSSSQSR